MVGSQGRCEKPPAATPPSLKKSTSGSQSSQSSKNQKSILGFFQKKTSEALQPNINGASRSNGLPSADDASSKTKLVQRSAKSNHSLTPAPSSDAICGEEEEDYDTTTKNPLMNGFPTPATPASNVKPKDNPQPSSSLQFSSPSRKVYKSTWCTSAHSSS
jgi:hypothetical protein